MSIMLVNNYEQIKLEIRNIQKEKGLKHVDDFLKNCNLSDYITDVFLYGDLAQGYSSDVTNIDILVCFDESIKQIKGYEYELLMLKKNITHVNEKIAKINMKTAIKGELKDDDLIIRKTGINFKNIDWNYEKDDNTKKPVKTEYEWER